jgi:hypothetical protein
MSDFIRIGGEKKITGFSRQSPQGMEICVPGSGSCPFPTVRKEIRSRGFLRLKRHRSFPQNLRASAAVHSLRRTGKPACHTTGMLLREMSKSRIYLLGLIVRRLGSGLHIAAHKRETL